MCAFKGGSNCSAHTVLGSVILAASIFDLILAFGVTVFSGFKKLLAFLSTNTRKVCLHLMLGSDSYSLHAALVRSRLQNFSHVLLTCNISLRSVGVQSSLVFADRNRGGHAFL